MSRTVGDLGSDELVERLNAGLVLRVGPFNLRVGASDSDLAQTIARCYPAYPLGLPGAYPHASARAVLARSGWWKRRRGIVQIDDGVVFSDYEPGYALPYIEWGLNWCIATRCHFFLMLHAAVVAKEGRAVVLPGNPGAGKSTLSAYLAHRGWRLLSDEFCLVELGTATISPFPRLIPLKNDAIDVIVAEIPEVRIGPRFADTRKGTVAHMTPPDEHARDTTPVTASLIVKPTFAASAKVECEAMPAAQAFVELSQNSFNYQILGRDGFITVAELATAAPGYALRYGDLAAAAACLEALFDEHARTH